jgi:hypothetical protein
MKSFRSRNIKSVHPGLHAVENGSRIVESIIIAAQFMLQDHYGYDFSDEQSFPNGFFDMLGHTDAYADWLWDNKHKFEDVDYELLSAIRVILDYR